MIAVLLLAALWAALTCWRIYRLARFFQIEEYMPSRFLRWIIAKRERGTPNRLVEGVVTGLVLFVALTAFAPDTLAIHVGFWAAIIVFIAWPEPVKEVKKTFKATQRAMRLLVTAFVLAIMFNLALAAILASIADEITASTLGAVSLIGMIAYLLAPLALSAANILMFPVESSMRRMFRERARQRLAQSRVKVIGITGSFGKTSTKDYLHHILSGRYQVIKTPKSYNTLMGVCLVINNDFDPNAGDDYFIIEMGAYIPGEIKRICELTKPQAGIVTAVGPQHLERFGTLENIVTAKYELVEAVPKDGFVAFNFDDDLVRGMGQRGYPDTCIGVSYGNPPREEARLIAQNIQHTLDGLKFDVVDRQTGEERTFNTTLIGLHNVTNILLATTVAHQLGMSLAEISLRVATLTATEHRLKQTRLPNGVMMLDDAYNTNPVGSASALEVLKLNQHGRRVLITPGMVELGPLHEQENEQLGQRAAAACTDIVLVGVEQTKPIQRGVKKAGFDETHLHVFETVTEAIQWYQAELKAGDAVLILNDLPDNYM